MLLTNAQDYSNRMKNSRVKLLAYFCELQRLRVLPLRQSKTMIHHLKFVFI